MITKCPRCGGSNLNIRDISQSYFRASCGCLSVKSRYTGAQFAIEIEGDKIYYLGFRAIDDSFIVRCGMFYDEMDILSGLNYEHIYAPYNKSLLTEGTIEDRVKNIVKYAEKYMSLQVFS